VQRAVLVTRGLVQAGAEVDVFTGTGVARLFEREGARFHDLHAGRPLESVDSTSMPIPSRFVTFAGVHGESLAMEISRLKPSLIVHGTFAVIALVVAKTLGLPRVAICSGHNQSPRSAIPPLAFDPRVATSEACFGAVRVLRERYGITNASPFSYFDSLSETLNIIPEPPEFLLGDETADFQPCAFWGCIDPLRHGVCPPQERDGRLKVYVAFGTISHRYYRANIEQALGAVVAAAMEMPQAEFTLSLGGVGLNVPDALPANVRIESFVDQWGELARADVFITHNGLNSTHEAVYLGKPMISYPLFADQPGLAKRCEELGLAVPLAEGLRAPVSAGMVRAAIEQVLSQKERMQANLITARDWEDRVIAARPDVVGKILACAR
jgi:MGT family glycosyltransferase